jgi:hypothetical protein
VVLCPCDNDPVHVGQRGSCPWNVDGVERAAKDNFQSSSVLQQTEEMIRINNFTQGQTDAVVPPEVSNEVHKVTSF